MELQKLQRIKSAIKPTSKLIEGGIPKTLNEKVCESINCYAYALGIMWQEADISFQPGFTEITDQIDSKIIIKGICWDLENLGVSYRRINLDGDKSLSECEYLIKVFYSKTGSLFPDGEFHCIRFDKSMGIWFHKLGYHEQPTVVSNYHYNVIWNGDEPNCFYDFHNYVSLKPLSYFAIQEK